jgi:acetyl-CoA decarbonylase/synthase complex subunit delta
MTIEIPKEKWPGAVREVTLGSAHGGGTRTATVTIGGETTLPFLHFEGAMPHRPVVAAEVADTQPGDWSPEVLSALGDATRDPAEWARAAVEHGAELIALKLRSCHPERGDMGAREAVGVVDRVLAAVGVPLIVYGPGVADKDNEVLVAVAEATKGERLALGLCEDKNYRTIVAAALGNGHLVIAFSPIDVNLDKQMNILISDMRLPLDRVLMDPNTGALGYGIEYTYSVMERLRLASLMGDAMTQQPMICNLGDEAWRQKESRAADGVPEAWGALETRGVAWETATAMTVLESGADVLVLRHPETLATIRAALSDLTKEA